VELQDAVQRLLRANQTAQPDDAVALINRRDLDLISSYLAGTLGLPDAKVGNLNLTLPSNPSAASEVLPPPPPPVRALAPAGAAGAAATDGNDAITTATAGVGKLTVSDAAVTATATATATAVGAAGAREREGQGAKKAGGGGNSKPRRRKIRLSAPEYQIATENLAPGAAGDVFEELWAMPSAEDNKPRPRIRAVIPVEQEEGDGGDFGWD
jgi:hypothetical protein